MKLPLLMCAAMVLVGCGEKAVIADRVVEERVRIFLKKPEGKLTEEDLEKVTRLNLSSTIITDAGLEEVTKLQKLTYIALSGTKITDEGLKEAANLEKLTSLWLWDTQITDAGLKEVAKLQKLEGLFLNRTQVTKAGVAELKKVLPNCKITGS